MEWINAYWKIITTIIVAALAIGSLQAQVETNKTRIKSDNLNSKAANADIIATIKASNKESKAAREKLYAKNEREIEKIKAKQEQQTVLRVNQTHIIESIRLIGEGMKETNKSIRTLSDEIRENERRRK